MREASQRGLYRPRRDNDANVRPFFGNTVSEFQTVHFARHLNVRKNKLQGVVLLKKTKRLISGPGLEHVEALVGNDIRRIHSDQRLIVDYEGDGDREGVKLIFRHHVRVTAPPDECSAPDSFP